jgi:hypothetical protein
MGVYGIRVLGLWVYTVGVRSAQILENCYYLFFTRKVEIMHGC